SLATTRTDCVDPTAPIAAAGAPGPNLLANGNFTSGLGPWFTYGTLTSQISGGVFEFVRPTSAPPAGVVVQNTSASVQAGEVLTATMKLGNSSSARKRVTVLVHAADFSDLAACTFWIPPGQPLSTYTMRSAATKDWSSAAGASISIYAATIGPETWT